VSARFDDYCRRKTEAAVAAQMPGFDMSTIARQAADGMVAVGNDWSRALFDGWFFRRPPEEGRGLPAVSLVFVQSADGNTGADDPSSLGGGETDKHLVYEGLSRVDAEGVLAGATTAAGSEIVFSVWHPELVRLRHERGRPRHPAQIILTERGDLPVHTSLLYNERELRTIVLASSTAAAVLARRLPGRPWVEVIDAGQPVDLRRALGELHARGINVISAVGGRRAAASLIEAGLVAELYLTTSAKKGGEPGTPLVDGPLPRHEVILEKVGRGVERGVRFQHLVFANR
jgi:riboflavin biosynthesis pyrimidine reductase